MLGPTLETARLILRPPEATDFDAFAAVMADEVVARYLGGAVPRSTAWRSFTGMAGGWVLQGFGMFSVIEKASHRWIGRIGPLRPEGWPGTEVGWGLDRSVWGRGLCERSGRARHRLGVRRSRLDRRHPLHRSRQRELGCRGATPRLAAITRGPPAPADRRFDGHLRPERARMARTLASRSERLAVHDHRNRSRPNHRAPGAGARGKALLWRSTRPSRDREAGGPESARWRVVSARQRTTTSCNRRWVRPASDRRRHVCFLSTIWMGASGA